MFIGRSALSLDAKGRIAIPARYRPLLVDAESGVPMVALSFNAGGFLSVYPVDAYRSLLGKIAEKGNKRAVRRKVFGLAEIMELDSNGRVLIPPYLREKAQLEKDLTLVGVGDSCELWATPRLIAQEAKDDESTSGGDLDAFDL